MRYKYGILRTDVSPEADEQNNALLGHLTLGIEITSLPLAVRCGLGNIDPQHGVGGEGGSSAIEEALNFPLPPDGAHLVTIRPDKDSFGAMAVLTLRAQDKGTRIDKRIISWIGAVDRLGIQNASRYYPELMGPREQTDALNVIIAQNKWPNVEQKISVICHILTLEMSEEEICAIAALQIRSYEDFQVEMHGALAFIEAPGRYQRARDWGNRRYPIVLIFDPAYTPPNGGTSHPRWTVVRQPGVFDRCHFEEAINVAEARARGISVAELTSRGLDWGGNRSIVSSKSGQGRESSLSRETIIAIAREHAESGRVS